MNESTAPKKESGEMIIGSISIYGPEIGGKDVDAPANFIDKDALVLAHQWGLLCGGLIPHFDGMDHLLHPPSDTTLRLQYSDTEFELFLKRDGRSELQVASGTSVERGQGCSMMGAKITTVYLVDRSGFAYSCHSVPVKLEP